MKITQITPGSTIIGRRVVSVEIMRDRHRQVCAWFTDGFMVMSATTIVDADDDPTFTLA